MLMINRGSMSAVAGMAWPAIRWMKKRRMKNKQTPPNNKAKTYSPSSLSCSETMLPVRTPEREVFQVRVGNYMGQDYGVVTAITDGEIRLKELVQDSAGDWTERSSTLQLIQAGSTTGERRK